jgi:hypothetical protein
MPSATDGARLTLGSWLKLSLGLLLYSGSGLVIHGLFGNGTGVGIVPPSDRSQEVTHQLAWMMR